MHAWSVRADTSALHMAVARGRCAGVHNSFLHCLLFLWSCLLRRLCCCNTPTTTGWQVAPQGQHVRQQEEPEHRTTSVFYCAVPAVLPASLACSLQRSVSTLVQGPTAESACTTGAASSAHAHRPQPGGPALQPQVLKDHSSGIRRQKEHVRKSCMHFSTQQISDRCGQR